MFGNDFLYVFNDKNFWIKFKLDPKSLKLNMMCVKRISPLEEVVLIDTVISCKTYKRYKKYNFELNSGAEEIVNLVIESLKGRKLTKEDWTSSDIVSNTMAAVMEECFHYIEDNNYYNYNYSNYSPLTIMIRSKMMLPEFPIFVIYNSELVLAITKDKKVFSNFKDNAEDCGEALVALMIGIEYAAGGSIFEGEYYEGFSLKEIESINIVCENITRYLYKYIESSKVINIEKVTIDICCNGDDDNAYFIKANIQVNDNKTKMSSKISCSISSDYVIDISEFEYLYPKLSHNLRVALFAVKKMYEEMVMQSVNNANYINENVAEFASKASDCIVANLTSVSGG